MFSPPLVACFVALAVVSQSAASESVSHIVSISDLHGDYERAVHILEAAGLMDALTGAWIGGNTTLVQTGDLVDRGTESIQLYRLFGRLASEAEEKGGQVINLLGNHELMNIQSDFRYVNSREKQAEGGRYNWQQLWEADGEIGSQVRKFKAAAKVGPVLFVHAGLLPVHLENGRTLHDLNVDMSAALLSNGYPRESKLERIVGEVGPLWTRFYTRGEHVVCNTVLQVLEQVGAQRMVVGHTIQETVDGKFRVNSLCGGSLILSDTAISSAYGGEMSFIEYIGAQEAIVHYPGLRIKEVLPKLPLVREDSVDSVL